MDDSQKIKGQIVKKEQQLLEFLSNTFPQNSKTSLKSWLQNLKVEVNGKTVKQANFILQTGDRVNIVKPQIGKKTKLKGVNILFEDEYLIVIDKETGLLSIAGNTKGEETAFRILSEHVKNSDPSNRIFVVHRLDKATSGVMMYAKTQAIQESLQKNWNKCILDRKYIAVVEGEIEKNKGIIKSWLTESSSFIVYSSFTENDGQFAELEYIKLKSNKAFSLVEVSLQTGRKNQIRVQMQAIGHSVVGDKKYGAKSNPIKRLALHAQTLHFIHPVSNKPLKFDVSPPSEFYNLVKK